MFCTSCVGFVNGYLAEPFNNSKLREIRDSYFPAVNSDTFILDKNLKNKNFNIVQKVAITTIIGIDYPISACIDILFLPIKGLVYIIHVKPEIKKKSSNQTVQLTAEPSPD